MNNLFLNKSAKPKPDDLKTVNINKNIIIENRDILTYTAALLGALAFLWSAFRLYKSKKPQKIDIDIYIVFFVSQILWIVNAVIDKDYLLLGFYSINVAIYFYIFYYYQTCRFK